MKVLDLGRTWKCSGEQSSTLAWIPTPHVPIVRSSSKNFKEAFSQSVYISK